MSVVRSPLTSSSPTLDPLPFSHAPNAGAWPTRSGIGARSCFSCDIFAPSSRMPLHWIIIHGNPSAATWVLMVSGRAPSIHSSASVFRCEPNNFMSAGQVGEWVSSSNAAVTS